MALVPAPTALPAAAAPAQTATAAPYVSGTETVPTYSYSAAVRQSVYVTAPFDSDGDGKSDKIAVDIVRPATEAGVKVPVIVDPSPYYTCCGRGNESEKKTYGSDGVVTKLPLFYDNYFVPRGYAVAGVDIVGTGRSTGCNDRGGPYEIGSAKVVVDWLNGRAAATDAAGNAVVADWTTGSVGMIGKSWDGSTANGVAATGVDGLKTIVPISSLSKLYDYERYNGVLRSSAYTSYLENYVNGRPAGVCDSRRKADQTAADDSTGNDNAWWQARDYTLGAAQVRASVFVVHGVNDLNVTTSHFGKWWSVLAANQVPRKIWITQNGHVDPFDTRRAVWVDTLHRWFDYWLQGLPNGIMSEPQATIQRADGSWVDEPGWPAATGTATTTLSSLGGTATRSITDNTSLSESAAVASPGSAVAGRTVFLSGALSQGLRVSGNADVKLRVRLTKGTSSEISVRLVDYGSQTRVDYSTGEGARTGTTESCWGDSTPADDACYKDVSQNFVTSGTDIITRGWLDARHYQSLSQQSTLTTGTWYTMTVPLNTTDAIFAKGHQLGVVVTLSDKAYTVPQTTGAVVQIDPTASALVMPTTGGTIASSVATAAQVRSGSTAPTKTATSARVMHRVDVPQR